MKAAIYSRFSTDRQNESSIVDQVRVCTEFAEREGMQVTQRYEDQGISGAALGNRPGARDVMEGALAGRFDVLLVMDLSRLSRSQADLPKMIDRMTARGVRVVGVQDGYDSGRKGHKLQAGLSGIIGEAFREMVKDKTYAALESRAKLQRPTGGRAFGYHDNKVDETEAAIVREIFSRFAAGSSCRAIASEMNARGLPSPGSTWKRLERRCGGWMGSAIRAMLRNERYTGAIVWNKSEWVKDPDSGKRLRRERPRAEWIAHQDESLRIVSDDVWHRVQARHRQTAQDSHWGVPRGKAKYLLSGLLRCEDCGAHYIIANATEYSCSGYVDGKVCGNNIRVRRDHLENVVLGPIYRDLLAPDRVERMAREMQAYYLERVRSSEARAEEAPRELQELDARIARLRDRMRLGDPDMPSDEIQLAIDRAERKRQELQDAQPSARHSARVLKMLPKAAEMYRRQITQGIDGDERSALKARVILREMFGGRIGLKREPDGSLWAQSQIQPGALLRAVGNDGSGGTHSQLFASLPRQRQKD